MTDNNDQLLRIEQQLDIVIRLLALLVTPESDSIIDRAVRLQKAGLQPKVIAGLCNSTPNAVSVALLKAKRQGKGKKTRR